MSNQTDTGTLHYPIYLQYEHCTESTFAWMAYHPDLPGCMAHGVTPEEAIAELAEARALYLEVLFPEGTPLPVPGSTCPCFTHAAEN